VRAGTGGEQRSIASRFICMSISMMPHQPIGQARLVILDQMDHVFAGDVARGYPRDAGPIERRIEAHLLDETVRDARANGAAPQLGGELHVVQVERSAGNLFLSVDAGRRLPDFAC